LLCLAVAGCDRSTPAGSSRSDGPGAASAAPAAEPSGLLGAGAPAPNIEAVAHTGETVKLTELRGRPVVVYFYPKDDTPGCTAEAQGIRDEWEAIKVSKAVVLGVSTDDNDSHKAFADKHSLPFLLLPDKDKSIARAFGVPVRFGLAKRVTFVIDKDGKIAKVFPDVSPKGHAQEVLAALTGL
jgi:peroxiredoxin Q/BCP